ncbi:MAG: hypothetical protein J6X10_07670 [Bacteroidales bacterium]|nr:hypothetical protein [Bacteroidales bacterium]
MKRFFAIFLLVSIVVVLFASCERNCYCTDLDTNTEGIVYGVYSKKDCRDMEKIYDNYECTYK